VQANAFGGNGGNITITAADAFLADAATCAQQACLNASSQLGVAGTVAVNTPTADLSGVVTPLAQTFAHATVLLPHRCAERLREQPVSTFVLAGRDGLPVQPGSVLPSPLLAEQRGGTPPPAARVWQTPALADGQRGRHAPGRPQGLGWQGQATSPRGLDLPCPQGRSEPAGPSVLHK
jgi:hypothetical protein